MYHLAAMQRLIFLLPALVFLALHARTLPYEFVWTDQTEIVRGTLVRPPGELARAFVEPMHRNLDFRSAGLSQPFYRPLLAVSVSLVHAAVGKRAPAYRSISLLTGAVTASLFAVLAWLLLRRVGPALFAGLVPAVHPASIEVYVWIASLSEALVDLFVVVSLLAALLALRAAEARTFRAWCAASVLALVLALLSRENGAVTPVLLVALAIAEAARGTGGWAALCGRARSLLPRAALVVGLHALVELSFLGLWRPYVLGGFPGSGGSLIGGSLVTQWLSALASWPKALGWLFFPLHSSTSDRIRIVESFAEPLAWLGLAIALGSVGLAAWGLRRGRAGVVLGAAWIWIAYLPAANLIPAAHPWAERYAYLSVFGAALLLADLGMLAAARASAQRALVAILAAVAVLGLAQRTWARAPDWRSSRTLFESDLARDPLYREGRFELALLLYQERRHAEAKRTLQPILEPSGEMRAHASFLREADAFELDCHLALSLRNPHQALDRLRQLQREQPGIGRGPGLRLCAARAHEMAGEPVKALELYLAVTRSLPGPPDPQLRIEVARALAMVGRRDEAAEWLSRLEPDAPRTPQLDRQIRAVERMIRQPRASGR
jgi:tetratricopeptide (TPR) repeat protein